MATHSSILTWRIPMGRGSWQTTVYGVTKGLESDMTTTAHACVGTGHIWEISVSCSQFC